MSNILRQKCNICMLKQKKFSANKNMRYKSKSNFDETLFKQVKSVNRTYFLIAIGRRTPNLYVISTLLQKVFWTVFPSSIILNISQSFGPKKHTSTTRAIEDEWKEDLGRSISMSLVYRRIRSFGLRSYRPFYVFQQKTSRCCNFVESQYT